MPHHITRFFVRTGPLRAFVLCLIWLFCALFFLPAADAHAACAATGEDEVTPAAVHQARMEAKAADGAFDFSSGSLDAAKVCADLINRISSMGMSGTSVPGLDDIIEAIEETAREAAEETVREACSYVAGTSSSWAASQAGIVRSRASAQASALVKANVSVTNPDAQTVISTWRTRLKGNLPGYSDLPSLR